MKPPLFYIAASPSDLFLEHNECSDYGVLSSMNSFKNTFMCIK